MINCKLRLFTPRSSYGANEMGPKSQLCACSFQDSLWQKNWAQSKSENFRIHSDTCGRLKTIRIRCVRVDARIFVSAKKCLRKKISEYVWTWPEIQQFKNFKIYKEMYGHPDALSDSVLMAIHFFVNFDIFKWLYLSYYWVYLHQTWGFCKTWSTLNDQVD